jgi:two-component system sensor histidine kinase ChvG
MGLKMLLFSSLFLLALPWLGYRYIDVMKEYLLQGQEESQSLAASAVATVLNDRTDLFYASSGQTDALLEQSALYVYPLDEPVLVDGYGGDWELLLERQKHYGPESVVFDRSGGSLPGVTFGLVLGEYKDKLYGFVSISDPNIVYRHPQYARLDNCDQVRLELTGPDGRTRRLALLTEGPGNVSVYDMQSDWKTPLNGQPEYKLAGVWQERNGGYDLEFRFPETWLGADKRMLLSVVNVSSPVERQVDQIVATLPGAGEGQLNRLITRSPELERILHGLDRADARICVVDRYRRVRAVLGGDAVDSTLCDSTDTVSVELVADALSGSHQVFRNRIDDDETRVTAAEPVFAGGDIVGAVLVEKNSTQLLGLQRKSLYQIIAATFVVFALATAGLLLFSGRLAYRIRRLQRQAAAAIDRNGRVLRTELKADGRARDELGQLSRGISGLLSQLKSYTGFLESVPRTLRHEILNPVNTISLSMQQLQKPDAKVNREDIINSACNATRQLELIVHSLTEAAHIEDVLRREVFEPFDLAALLGEYVRNSQLKHTTHLMVYRGPESGIEIRGSDLRIAQLLDKLKDNAIDFAEPDSDIVFEVKADQHNTELCVTNRGPIIPLEIMSTLCTGMASSRPASDGKPHLGIGLFIASRIAQLHGGKLDVANLDDGVRVCLILPVEHA